MYGFTVPSDVAASEPSFAGKGAPDDEDALLLVDVTEGGLEDESAFVYRD